MRIDAAEAERSQAQEITHQFPESYGWPVGNFNSAPFLWPSSSDRARRAIPLQAFGHRR